MPRQPRQPRQPRERTPVTEAKLLEVALAYLNRVPASKQALVRKLESWIRTRGEPADPEPARPLIAALIERYERSRILDDERLAKNVAESLRARGASARGIAHRLAQRGLDSTSITHALSVEGQSASEADLTAARQLVRRRRLGPFRPEPERAAKRSRDLAALARAGFDFDTARRALHQDSSEDEDENTEF